LVLLVLLATIAILAGANGPRPTRRSKPTGRSQPTANALVGVSDHGNVPDAPRVTRARRVFGFRIGGASHQGYVRKSNQDRVHAIHFDKWAILVVADGCGGHAHGEEAAELAADTAALSTVIKVASTGPKADPTEISRQAVQDASLRLVKEGVRRQLDGPEGGLRTTLIVVVAKLGEVGFSHIGDGGACVVSCTGEVRHFIEPQKDPRKPNVLTASLGPKQDGELISGSLQLEPGQLLIAGTDGVFDRVEDCFFQDVFRMATRGNGNLVKTAWAIVDAMTSRQDGAGYICDDNTTLGMLQFLSPKRSRSKTIKANHEC
ncbi:MAG TPA: protein phosphatase 2C domain-containing protein, partial [Gemmataceae bacterium]|nr:protein phosphatase 2C domain-containing protein [Gemmataceae bacterium]